MKSVSAVFFSLLLASSAGCAKDDKPQGTATATAAATPASPKAKPAAVETITFLKKAPQVSTRTQQRSATHMNITINVDPTGSGKPQTSEVETTETETKTEQILAVNGDVVTKLQVTFVEKAERNKQGKDVVPTNKPSPLSGRTFILESKNGQLVASELLGTPVSSADVLILEKSYKLLGKTDPVLAAMPARALKAGDKVDELGKAIRERMNGAGGMSVTHVAVSLREQNDEEGIFDVTMELTKADGPIKFVVDLKGDMHVRLSDSQTTSLNLAGPVGVGANEADKGKSKMQVDGSGKMELSATSSKL